MKLSTLFSRALTRKKFDTIYPFFILCSVWALFSAYSTGRAAAGYANTGAPGDDELSPGTPYTCAACHNTGTYKPTIEILFFDSLGTNAVTKYTPNKVYTIKVVIKATSGAPKAYGFQMTDLRKSDLTDAQGFLAQDKQPDQYVHIVALTSKKRTYAEHPTPNPSNTFSVKWKAPSSKNGPIVFYAVGNAVNADGGQSGDNGVNTSAEIAETSTAVEEAQLNAAAISISPNPVAATASVSYYSAYAKIVDVQLFDLNGRIAYQDKWDLTVGENIKNIETSGLARGIYICKIEDGKTNASAKLFKL